MRRIFVAACAAVVLAAACTATSGTSGGGSSPSVVHTIDPNASHQPVTLVVWDWFRERELSNLEQITAGFEKQYPWIKLQFVPGKHTGDYVRAINGNVPIDVAIDWGPDNIGKYCSTGAWVDLAPYIKAYGLDMGATFPKSALTYTRYGGVQCSLPVLTDAYGLYYNKEMFAKAGISGPPRTLSELTDDAKKLTEFNPDGSIKVAGFVPISTFYENPNLYDGNPWGAQWYKSDGTSAFASDPAWAQMAQWDKALTDWYGYEKLQAFYADIGGPDSEWSSAHAFEQGKVAMLYDGEWRVSFIQNDHAQIDYGTAPFPVADDKPDLYGSGQVGGTIIGIPRTAQYPDEAWLLVQWLSTQTKPLNDLADLLKNVPTTKESLQTTNLANDPLFKPFMEIYQDPASYHYPLKPSGSADSDALATFLGDWEAGKISDLQQGLQNLAQQVDEQQQLG
jgi:multiple sugar transport system substrate-binding protein